MAKPLCANKPMIFFKGVMNMKKFKKIAAAAASLAVIATSMTAFASSTQKRPRDASGDGEVRLNDAIFTRFYLQGMYNPTNIKAFDFDGNGIISWMDVDKINHYILKNLNEDDYEEYINEYTPAYATTREYVRHYYNNSASNPITEYSLTVNPSDNTAAPSSNSQQRLIIGDNDMIRDHDTAVVSLWVGNSKIGSSFIVGKHVIATAAHCVYTGSIFRNIQIKLTNSNNNSIMVTPKYTDLNKVFYTNYHNGYSNTCRDNDYALIYVEEDLSQYGALKMGVALDEYVEREGEVIVSGFPNPLAYPENYANQPNGLRFEAKGKILPLYTTNKMLAYDADTYSGVSGGPVYAEEGFVNTVGEVFDYKTVIAINVSHHDSENDEFKRNLGVRITPDLLKFYYDNSNINY